jgi:AraC family transcriptional regulator
MTTSNEKASIEVETTLRSPNALIQLVHYNFNEPPSGIVGGQREFRIELCLTARHHSARGCFSDVWSPYRYERIGDLFIAPCDIKLHALADEETPLTSVICEFNREPMLQLFAERAEPYDSFLIDKFLLASLDVQDSRARNGMLRLAEEARQPGFASEILTESIVMQLLVDLFRFGMDIYERQSPGGLAPWQLKRIEERLNEVCEAPSLSMLADLCRLSVRQLTRSFRASRGCSIGTYVSQRQIEHAKSLLSDDNSVASIATTLGFSSPSNFSVAFRRETGLTPGQFRQRLLRGL